VIEPPSSRLQQNLTALNLCRRSDLRRCRRRVRQLARDLPAFDSVWIDALLQDRKLTPFQARLLESPHTGRLSVGPCVLVDQLGSGPHGETFLASVGNTKQRCVLKLVSGGVVSGGVVSGERSVVSGRQDVSGIRSRETGSQYSVLSTQYAVPIHHSPLTPHPSPLTPLQSLIDRAGAEPHPNVVAPHKVLVHDGRLVVLSRFVAGTPLIELLIRRGRFPANVVQEIGRQLIGGLAHLESRNIVHGEIALWNVRLSSKGIVTLVDAGIAPIVRPEVLIDAGSPPERFDGVAPERVATGNPATASSDIYALGCLLWQLLAGRPPFPTGDPLTKLAHHQTRLVADVREWVPDCPGPLAELLTAMTVFEPLARPASFADLANRRQTSTRTGRRRLLRFHASFRAAAPRIRLRPTGAGFVKRTLTACAALAAATLGIGLLDRDFRGPLLSIASPITKRIAALTEPDRGKRKADMASRERQRPESSGGLRPPARQIPFPLPAADSNGAIELAGSRNYLWTKPIRSDRPIVIRCAAGKPALVMVGATAAFVSAPEVSLENVRLVVRAESQALQRNSAPLLTVRSDRLFVKRCGFQAPNGGIAIDWTARTPAGRGAEIVLKDDVITGGTTAVRLGSVPSAVRCENVLHVGPGTLCRFTRLPAAGITTNVVLVQVTQRDATALLHADLPLGNGSFGRIAVSAKNCVFHYAGNDSAMCVFGTSFPGQIPRNIVRFSGEGSLFSPGGRIAVEAAVGSASAVREDNDAVQVDGGLLACEFEFAGPAGSGPATSVIVKHRAPVRSQHKPGIDARRLLSIRP
jgi:eukaryotic-like serine/threonine-protein kinase